jgi:hypothetical protein
MRARTSFPILAALVLWASACGLAIGSADLDAVYCTAEGQRDRPTCNDGQICLQGVCTQCAPLEVCGNGLDDDCSGKSDDGCPPSKDASLDSADTSVGAGGTGGAGGSTAGGNGGAAGPDSSSGSGGAAGTAGSPQGGAAGVAGVAGASNGGASGQAGTAGTAGQAGGAGATGQGGAPACDPIGTDCVSWNSHCCDVCCSLAVGICKVSSGNPCQNGSDCCAGTCVQGKCYGI